MQHSRVLYTFDIVYVDILSHIIGQILQSLTLPKPYMRSNMEYRGSSNVLLVHHHAHETMTLVLAFPVEGLRFLMFFSLVRVCVLLGRCVTP
jgi:hypothetical protein